MSRTGWLIAAGAALIAALVVLPFFSKQSQGAGPGGLAGHPVEVIALQDDSGATASLAQLRGKVAVVNLWASWCPPCRAEMPDLQRLVETDGSRGVVVVGINQGESAESARAFARSLGVTFPIWVDAQQQYGRAFGALGLPTTVIVGRDGVVVRGFDGPLTFDDMRRAVDPLLKS